MKEGKIFLLFVLMYITTVSSQENTTNFLNNYKKWSFFWQYKINNTGTVHKEDSNVQFSVPLYVNKRFGFLYNVYKTKQFNFKTGVLYETILEENNFGFTKEQTGWYKDFTSAEILYEDQKNMWSIPFMAEYIYPISKTVKWVVGGSFTFSSYTSFSGVLEVPFEYDPTIRIRIIHDDLSRKKLHTSVAISTGFYFLLKPLLLQASLRYSKSFTTLKSGSYKTINFIDASNNTTGTYIQSGDYLGFSLTVNFRKKGK